MARREPRLLAEVNAIRIAKDDLLTLTTDCQRWHRDHPDEDHFFEVAMCLIAKRAKRDHLKAFAIWCRMSALAQLAEAGHVRGWTLPERTADGGILASEAVFEAAAVHPLIQRKREWVFERRSFLHRVLELADSEATA
jgi:hypothetical protein